MKWAVVQLQFLPKHTAFFNSTHPQLPTIPHNFESNDRMTERGGLRVLLEDNHCLAILKPAGMLTMGDRTEDVSVVDLAREYLRRKYDKPGKVFVGVVHRLDRPVSGVLLLARTSKGAARLSEQLRKHSVRKVYQCVVEGRPPQREGELVDLLAKDESTNVSRVVEQQSEVRGQGSDSGKESQLRYRCLQSARGLSLLEIELLTGRSHQIRVQLASRGLPICGDAKYGSRTKLEGWLALHAASLTFEHPTRGESITVAAPHPTEWMRFGFGVR
jgi:23S rRNA pseudouridine1911/1915/1917 synthase